MTYLVGAANLESSGEFEGSSVDVDTRERPGTYSSVAKRTAHPSG